MSKRDYSSFSSAAKSRFRYVAEEVGFAQITGTVYARRKEGWYETFNLQASQYGSDTFYVNFGIAVPQLCPVEEERDLKECGLILSERLRNTDDTGGFDANTKAEMEESAGRVLSQLRSVAVPWFAQRSSWESIAADYYELNPIEEEMIGAHTTEYGADFRSATYGYLLLRAGNASDARRWLLEAKRLMSLPVYYTRDGRTVHEKEKHARLQKPEPSDLEALREVEATLALISGGNLTTH